MRISDGYTEENSLLLRSLEVLLKRSELWLTRILQSKETSDYDKKLAVAKCSVGIMKVFKLMKVNPLGRTVTEDNEGTSIQFLGSYVQLLDETLHSLGGPYSVMLSLWNAEKWNHIRQEFLREETQHVDEK